MSRLFVITVRPDDLPLAERADGFAVLLADGVLPGLYLGRYPNERLADAACRFFGAHYDLHAYPLDSPGSRRSELHIIRGGKL